MVAGAAAAGGVVNGRTIWTKEQWRKCHKDLDHPPPTPPPPPPPVSTKITLSPTSHPLPYQEGNPLLLAGHPPRDSSGARHPGDRRMIARMSLVGAPRRLHRHPAGLSVPTPPIAALTILRLTQRRQRIAREHVFPPTTLCPGGSIIPTSHWRATQVLLVVMGGVVVGQGRHSSLLKAVLTFGGPREGFKFFYFS